MAPQGRRAAVAACREPVGDGLALAARFKETPQQLRSAGLLHAADDLGPAVAGRLLKDAGAVLDPPALGVGGTEVEPAQPSKWRSPARTWRRAPV